MRYESHNYFHHVQRQFCLHFDESYDAKRGEMRDADYADESDSGTFEERLTARAFANLRETVNGSSEIEEAIEREVTRLCPEESADES